MPPPIGGQMKLSTAPSDDDGEGGDDRHRAFAGEEAEIARELEPVEAVEGRGGNQTDDDAAEDAGLDRGNAHDRRGLDARSLAKMPIAAMKTT